MVTLTIHGRDRQSWFRNVDSFYAGEARAKHHSFYFGPTPSGLDLVVGAVDAEPPFSCRHERTGRRGLYLATRPDERRQRIFNIHRRGTKEGDPERRVRELLRRAAGQGGVR